MFAHHNSFGVLEAFDFERMAENGYFSGEGKFRIKIYEKWLTEARRSIRMAAKALKDIKNRELTNAT